MVFYFTVKDRREIIKIGPGLLLKRPGSQNRGMRKMATFPTIDMEKTGLNIVRLRKEAGLTVKDLQQIFGFGTPQAIYKWQRGIALPTIDNLVVLAAAFNVKVDDILIYGDSFRIGFTA